MDSNALVLSVSETMAMLMKSMGHYVYRRLGTVEGKEAYRVAMKECIQHVSSGLTNLDMIKAKIEGIRDDASHRYPKRMFNKRLEERRCHEMAVDQALDIVSSLEKRFILGQSDDAPRNYNGRGIVYEDQSIF